VSIAHDLLGARHVVVLDRVVGWLLNCAKVPSHNWCSPHGTTFGLPFSWVATVGFSP
jgi:hypothetical protein